MIQGLNHITLAVRDINVSFQFYRKILHFKPLVKWHAGAYFILNDGAWFCLNVDANRVPNPCYTHIAFSVAQTDFLKVKQNLLNAGVDVFQENISEGDSFYFLDPDGHKLELHVGNAASRMAHKKTNLGTWQAVEWFVD